MLLWLPLFAVAAALAAAAILNMQAVLMGSIHEQVKVTQSWKYLYGAAADSDAAVHWAEHSPWAATTTTAHPATAISATNISAAATTTPPAAPNAAKVLLLLLDVAPAVCCINLLQPAIRVKPRMAYRTPAILTCLACCIHGKNSNPAQNPEIDIGSCNCVPRTRWKLRRAIRQGRCC